jgi:hypothetical protein
MLHFSVSQKKELENLAAMDLELQKIAEKFSQRG